MGKINLTRNKKIMIGILILLIIGLCIAVYTSGTKRSKTNIKTTPLPTESVKPIYKPLDENDPNLWIDEKGNPILSDN